MALDRTSKRIKPVVDCTEGIRLSVIVCRIWNGGGVYVRDCWLKMLTCAHCKEPLWFLDCFLVDFP